jgi:hypothetical protein
MAGKHRKIIALTIVGLMLFSTVASAMAFFAYM